MKITSAFYIWIALFSALFFFYPETSFSATITLDVPTDPYPTIQSAIDYGNTQFVTFGSGTTYVVNVANGTYSGGIQLKSGISALQGEETSRTIISGVSGTSAVTASDLSGVVEFLRFTIINSSVGISVINSDVRISNTVFADGTKANIGVQIAGSGSSAATVNNNTFYQNETAISSDQDIQIEANLFSDNTTNVGPITTTFTKISNNCVFPVPQASDPTVTSTDVDNAVNFVSTPARDFHLTNSSLCTGGSTTNQFGAFGGNEADRIPFPVTIQSAALATSTSIALSWSQNLAFDVTGQTSPSVPKGHYNIYYRFGQSGPPYDATLSTVDSTITSTIISGLTTTASAPDAPILWAVRYADKILILNWTPVSNAIGYIIHNQDITDGTPVQSLNVGNVLTYTLGNLTNGHEYRVTITAYTQAAYFFSVTALDYSNNESDFSPEASVRVGSIAESAESNALVESPDALIPAANLPNKGCFIATAAYGSYYASQVKTLREFRDKYLITNRPGRAFVDWYYRYGPIGARYMEEHPWTKPLVRTALLPAVGVAGFIVHTPALTRIVLLPVMASMLLVLWYKRGRRTVCREAQEKPK